MWVDDPHFNIGFHVRHTALPRPGGDDGAQAPGRPGVLARRSTARRPLWELWLVEGLADDRFALLSKTHHALVDGVSGVDIATVLFDTSPDPMPVAPPEHEWVPQPAADRRPAARPTRCSSGRRCPAEIARGVRAVLRGPAAGGRRARPRPLAGVGAMALAGLAARARRARSTSGSAPTAASPGSAATSTSSRRSRTRSAGRSTTSCWRPWPARSGATCARTATTPTASCSGRWCRSRCAPTSSAARSATASPRCGRRCRSASPTRSRACARSARRWRASRSPARRSARRS